METAMKQTPKTIGEIVKSTRKTLGVTQRNLALTSGTGLRFIIELEKGKPTCRLDKVLAVLQTLGITITLTPSQVSQTNKAPASSAAIQSPAKGN
jgi:y4mF family transcriptional regulator